jgi:hypothetical protein
LSNNFSFDFLGNQKPSSRGLTDPVDIVSEPDEPTLPVPILLDTMFDIFMQRFDELERQIAELKNGS